MFVYKEKCIFKCLEKVFFVFSRNCVVFCLFVYDDYYICMRECFENIYFDGKCCKNGCLLFFLFKDYIYKLKCIEKCEGNEFVIENNRCILSLECFGFIYYLWCF